MKKLIIIPTLFILFILFLTVFFVTGCSQVMGGVAEIPTNLELKAPKEKILKNKEIDDIRCNKETAECVKVGRMVKYDYITDKKVGKKEDYLWREGDATKNPYTNTKKLNNGQVEFYTGDNFYHDGTDVYEIEHGSTTTPEAYAEETKVTFLDKLLPKVYAASPETYYPSDDGNIYTSEESSWATVYGASAGAGISASAQGGYVMAKSEAGPNFQIYAGFINFDTSALPDGATVTGVDLTVTGVAVGGTGDTFGVYLSTASDTIVTGDFDQRSDTSASDTTVTQATFNIESGNTFALNANGIAQVDTTGITKYSIREITHDVNNLEPPVANHTILYYLSAETGTAKDPKIVVTYTEAPSDTCTYGGSGDWNVTMSDNCFVTSDVYVDGELILNGTGTFGCEGVTISYDNLVKLVGQGINKNITCNTVNRY